MNPLPTGREGWLIEIARAFRDASEAIPFGPLAGAPLGAAETLPSRPGDRAQISENALAGTNSNTIPPEGA
jgi:hypothetical protein